MQTNKTKPVITAHAEAVQIPVILTTKDVAAILGCSLATARQVLRSPSCPALKIGKNYKICQQAFFEWMMCRHC